jgi:radical SAM protein with 4Fe4S-binding SPASM domain
MSSLIAIKIMLPALINKLLFRKYPVKIGLQVSADCNLDCAYCHFKDEQKDKLSQLSLDHIFAAIDDFKKMNISILSLTGGEPLLYDNLDKIISYAAKTKKIITGVATNGTLLTEKVAREHKNAGLSWYHMTIDGHDEDTYNINRGVGVFKSVDNAIDIAINSGINVIATTVVTRCNFKKLFDIATYIKSKKIKMWAPTLAIPCGKGKEFLKENMFSKEEVLKIYADINHISKVVKNFNVFPMDTQLYYSIICSQNNVNPMKKLMYSFMGGCASIKGTTIHINYDGTVKPCAYFQNNVPDVNIKKHSIIDIYQNSPYLKKLRDSSNLQGKCKGCKYLFCCGGCRARAIAFTENEFSEDPYCSLKIGS